MHQFLFSGRRVYILPVDYPGWEGFCSNDVVPAQMMFLLTSHKTAASSGPWVIQISFSFCGLHSQITHSCGAEDRECLIQTQAQPSGDVKNKEDTLNYTSLWLKVLIEPSTVAQICVWDFIAQTSLKQWEKKLSTISEQNNSNLSGHSSSMKPGMLRKVVICQNLKF